MVHLRTTRITVRRETSNNFPLSTSLTWKSSTRAMLFRCQRMKRSDMGVCLAPDDWIVVVPIVGTNLDCCAEAGPFD